MRTNHFTLNCLCTSKATLPPPPTPPTPQGEKDDQAYQVRDDDGAISVLPGGWIAPFSAFKNLKKAKQEDEKLPETPRSARAAVHGAPYHPENGVRTTASLIHLRGAVMSVL